LTSLHILDQLGGLPSLLSQLNSKPISVHNIDNSVLACTAAQLLSRKLGISCLNMSFAVGDAESDLEDLQGVDVVYVAALVGSTGQEKRKIFSNVIRRMRPGALLVIRSAKGLRSLLYPVSLFLSLNRSPFLPPGIITSHFLFRFLARLPQPCEESSCKPELTQDNIQVVEVASDFDLNRFEPLLEIHPYNHIINSVIIGRIRDIEAKASGHKNGDGVAREHGSANGKALVNGHMKSRTSTAQDEGKEVGAEE
jgi:hypothetical protein